MSFDLQRWTLFLSVLILSTGYLAVFRPLETSIAERYAAIDDARATIERSAELERVTARIEAESRSRETALRRLHLPSSKAAVADRFLQTLALVAARNALTLESLLAGSTAPALATAPAGAAPFDELPLEVTVRGRYRDLIAAVRDLDSSDVAARIAIAELRPVTHRPGAAPDLDASFHVTLLREADATHANSHR